MDDYHVDDDDDGDGDGNGKGDGYTAVKVVHVAPNWSTSSDSAQCHVKRKWQCLDFLDGDPDEPQFLRVVQKRKKKKGKSFPTATNFLKRHKCFAKKKEKKMKENRQQGQCSGE